VVFGFRWENVLKYLRALREAGVLHVASCCLAIVLVLTGHASAKDFDDGLAAYKNGDYQSAAKLFTRCAEEDADCLNILALMVDTGNQFPRDQPKADQMYKRAAERGNADAAFNYAANQRGQLSKGELVHYYTLTFRNAKGGGNRYLGLRFLFLELGCGFNDKLGVGSREMARHSAKETAPNEINACYPLDMAYKYLYGIDLPESYVDAFKWFNLAASNAKASAILHQQANAEKELLRKKMSIDQIGRAQELSVACFKSRYEICE
jgi:TPR repeat protein